MNFDDREIATILAALRERQARLEKRVTIGDELEDVATNGGELESLSAEEIDELCARLNFGDADGGEPVLSFKLAALEEILYRENAVIAAEDVPILLKVLLEDRGFAVPEPIEKKIREAAIERGDIDEDVEVSEALRGVIGALPRERVVSLLESAGIACFDGEPLEQLREALAVNIEDGTIERSSLELE